MIDDLTPGKRQAKSVPVNSIDTTAIKTKTPDTDSFLTPEQMAALDDIDTIPTTPENAPTPVKPTAGKTTLRQKIARSWKTNRREWLISAGIIIIGGVIVATVLTRLEDKPVVSAVKPAKVAKVAPKPTTVASTLSGLQVAPELNAKPVTGVMIENSQAARPQSGLSQAGVMFEAIAEGGITRFLALFQDTAPDDVGPIRSARPYYLQWAMGFDAGYAHVGGSPEALANIKAWGVKDLDQFANGGSYHRISSREAPHNVYTSIAALNQLEAAKGYTTSTYTGFVRKADAPSKTPNAKAIDMDLSGPLYNVHYDYNAANNSYLRSEGGGPHMDATTNVQLSPKVVVGLIMPYGIASDGSHSVYNSIGSGAAYVFQDGVVTIGQWSKAANNAQFTFTDAAGKPLKFNPGQTWLTALGLASEVSYTP
ncbi:MAG: hypothetical protein JWO35_88 [Candidatus Saccharibacteria bacterium]|nr:hypothetical protein [Candidatus Saccharibacteria bacterium]